MATAFAIAAFALTCSAARAQSYSGNWPMKVTKSHYANGKYCVTLTDDGSLGWRHSGEASLVPSGGTYPGSFTVIEGLISVNIPAPTGDGSLEFLLFTAPASGGHIGKGFYELAYGGYNDAGVLVFGKKGGCGNRQ
jgi:hypothetical protein